MLAPATPGSTPAICCDLAGRASPLTGLASHQTSRRKLLIEKSRPRTLVGLVSTLLGARCTPAPIPPSRLTLVAGPAHPLAGRAQSTARCTARCGRWGYGVFSFRPSWCGCSRSPEGACLVRGSTSSGAAMPGVHALVELDAGPRPAPPRSSAASLRLAAWGSWRWWPAGPLGLVAVIGAVAF